MRGGDPGGIGGRIAALRAMKRVNLRNGLKKLPFPAIKPVIDIW